MPEKDRLARVYLPCAHEAVPPGTKWNAVGGPHGKARTFYSAFGADYKLVRTVATGAVAYFKATDEPPAKSPAESIDAEPRRGRTAYPVGSQCWLVISGTWFLVQIVARTEFRMTVKSATGQDAERRVDWPYGELLDFPVARNRSKVGLGLFERLRPLSARRL